MQDQKIVVLILGVLGILAVAGGLALTVLGKSVPDSIIALGSAGVGALSTYLVQPKSE